MIFWHVSFSKINKFIPRVPKVRIEGEDGIIPRICVSTLPRSCINAMPGGGLALKGLLKMADKKYLTPIIYAYCVEMPERDKRLVPPQILKEKYGVLDAIQNNEYWITEPVDFNERVLLIEGAKFIEVDDNCGGRGLIVEQLDSDIPEILPERTFDKAFPEIQKKLKNKSIDIRQALIAISGQHQPNGFSG